ncbi:hypothetical protein DYB37_005276 [Aphanomyces astaci]|uniref:Peptidase M12B domain-containing protein n=1 Tax=Aphanomyces astaci TaxID=112090 RepID=A0A418EQ19_APHAT|nr:hypothetical protein DYB35_001947 [Aphanomyces astaci]RHZ16984.1 hypothetical protein DYB37_005276 [Aphanomyces astaci]
MNAAQAAAVGAGYGADIFHPTIAEFHPEPDGDTCFSDEDDQSHDAFVDMGKRRPNAKGTGRWKRTPRRRKLGLLILPTSSAKPSTTDSKSSVEMTCDVLRRFLAAYLCIEVDILPTDAVEWNASSRSLRIHGSEYIGRVGTPGQVTKQKKNATSKRKRSPNDVCLDVFSIFEAFEHAKFVQSPYFSMLVVTPLGLVEDVDGAFVEVLGRSYPDRVACVSLNQSLKSLLVTSAHELLHAMGVDHCSSFACVMNAISSDANWLLLSPPNLRKLKTFHGIPDSNTTFVVDRYTHLVDVLSTTSQLSSVWAVEVDMLTRKLHAMKQLGLY